MRSTSVWCMILLFSSPAVPCAQETARAQEAHWGTQGDVGTAMFRVSFASSFGTATVRVGGVALSVGMVRFDAENTPRFGINYSRIDFDFSASLDEFTGSNKYGVQGNALIHGLVITKYIRIFKLGPVRIVGALGIGAGRFSFNYTLFQNADFEHPTEVRHIKEVWVPMLELLFYGDTNLPFFERTVSAGPLWGFRNGMVVLGGTLRFHF